jgi:hypothetical protein
MATSWRCIAKPHFAQRFESSRMARCTPLIFNDGDFVDVSFSIDISSFVNKKGNRQVNTYFNIEQVVQLRTVDQVSDVCFAFSLIPDKSMLTC